MLRSSVSDAIHEFLEVGRNEILGIFQSRLQKTALAAVFRVLLYQFLVEFGLSFPQHFSLRLNGSLWISGSAWNDGLLSVKRVASTFAFEKLNGFSDEEDFLRQFERDMAWNQLRPQLVAP